MSENPEEQPSTGVLGRIGSWLSPWRGKGPRRSSESLSPSDEPDLKLAEEAGRGDECGRAPTEEQQTEGESSSLSPSLLVLSRDGLLSQEEDATQSSHRESSAVCSTESEEGGPKGEECAETRKRRTGQGREREENRNSILESGNPEKNASHVTPHSSFPKQGVLWDCGLSQPPVQRRTESERGKRIQVYLEESVIKRGKYANFEQEVVRTKVEQSLSIRQSTLSASVESGEGTGRNVTPTNGTESFYCAQEGVSLRLNKDTQFNPESEKKQTEAVSMGRKNAARRKSRKSPQREAGSSQPDKKSLNSEKGSPLPGSAATNAEGKSPKAEVVNSSSVPSPTSQLSPALKQGKTSCPDVVKLDKLPNADAASGATPAQGMDGVADKEDDESLYKVERKTETPESKRRSMKTSRSEIKLFPKQVHLNPKKNDLDSKSTKIEDKGSSEPISGMEPKEPGLKKMEEEQKPRANRIADKINLFERSALQSSKQAFHVPRSADVSPVRRATRKLNENVLQLEQRSRSAERARYSSSSPPREKKLSIEDRKKKFLQASTGRDAAAAALPPKSEMTGMSQICTSPATVAGSNTGGPDILDAKEQIQAGTTLGVSLKPEGPERGKEEVGSISMAKEDAAHTKYEDNVVLQTTNQGEKPGSEAEVLASEPDNSEELTKRSSPQSKGPCVKESHPISPFGLIEAEFGKNQEQVAERTALPDKPLASLPDQASLSGSKENISVVPDKVEAPPAASSSTEDSAVKPVRREEAKVHVYEDEPDTAAASTRTKTPLDKEAVILPPKEEAAVGQSLPFTQEAADPREGNETPSSPDSPLLTQQVEREENPSVEQPQPNGDKSEDSQQKTEEKVNESNKDTTPPLQLQDAKPINRIKGKDLKSDSEGKTEDKESLQQILFLNKSAQESGRVEIVGESEGSVSLADDKKNVRQSQAETDKSEATTAYSTPVETSIPTTQPQHNGGSSATHTQNGKLDKEAAIETQGEKEPLTGETNLASHLPEVSPEISTATESTVIAVEPQIESVLLEQRDKTPDDSCAHGANDAQLSVAEPVTEAVKAASGESAAAITTQAHNVSDSGSFTGESTPICSPQSVSSKEAGRGDDDDGKNTSAGISVPPLSTLSAVSSSKNAQLPSEGITSGAEGTKQPGTIPTATAAEKTPDKPSLLPIIDISPITDKDVPKHPTRESFKKALPPLPASPEGNKWPQRSSPRGLSRDDSAMPDDAPSSWLDVDLPVRKLKMTPRKLSYSGSESNLLDTSDDLDDEEFVERIKKLCAPFSAPLRKHNPLKPPQPTFAMPAIREDRFEKTFDPEEFTFGLRKSSKYTMDSTLSTLAKMQSFKTKAGLRPARASLADRSILLSSLDTQSRLKSPDKEEEEEEEGCKDKEEKVKVKSRLEGSCVLSSLTFFSRAKREALSSQVDGAITRGPVSPTEPQAQSSPPPPVSQPHPSSPTVLAPVKAAPVVEQGPAAGGGDQVPAVQPAVSDSCPPLPSFDDIKLPDFLEKYRNQETEKPAKSKQEKEPVKMELTEKKPPQTSGAEALKAVKPGPPPSAPPSLPGNPPTKHQTLTELKQPPAQPQAVLSNNLKKRVAKGFHKRPGKLVLFEKAAFAGQAYEINRDAADTTSLKLSPLISVKVVRGCWLLYEKPDFQGRTVALEEGGLELSNLWTDPEQQMEAQNDMPVLIGSIRLVVCDYSLPHIDLFTEPEGRGRVTPYHDDTVETGSFGIPLSTASIQVHSGAWLVFSDPGFQGMLAVLETGVYPYPESWGFPSPFIGSLRPLKMGVIKVENANEVKALVYDQPRFQGSCLEIDADVFSFCQSEAGFSAAGAHVDSKNLKSVGSLKVIGGLWVGYSEPGFEGQQHILEEGEYLDCRDWGGSEQLLSLQPVLSDFFTPHLKMFRDPAFGGRGGNVDLTVPVINLEETGFGMRTQSIDVISGVWVVFEEPGFSGEPHILERGLYGCPEDWGALQPRVGSAMTVVLDDFESTAKFKVQLFSEPAFQGSVLGLEDSAASLQDGFSVGSCKVLAGSWLAFEGQDFTGRMYVLEAGSYSDLRTIGCSQANPSILSMQTTGFEFSLPSITLFERRGLRGKRVVLTDGTVNLQLAGGCARVQSLLVEGGMWVLYEGINYRGAQLFLRPGEVPDWREISTWQKIGSLRPLAQPQVHFRVRNRQTGLMMAVTGDLDDIKLMRIQEMEESGELDQIWFYQNGRLHCKLLEECFLAPSGSITIAGSRVGLSPEGENHLWSITTEGFICYSSAPGLVLDVKGGHHYDKNQVTLNTMDPNKEQQLWDVELL